MQCLPTVYIADKKKTIDEIGDKDRPTLPIPDTVLPDRKSQQSVVPTLSKLPIQSSRDLVLFVWRLWSHVTWPGTEEDDLEVEDLLEQQHPFLPSEHLHL